MRVVNHHSFNTAVAEDFGVEKAIILEHFVFWVRKNYANRKNIYKDGKAYTYNSAEAFAEIFTYFKARKIAELLRQMEADGLIQSIQIHGTDRKKSYTVSDKGWSYYTVQVSDSGMTETEPMDCQDNDAPLSENCIMENTEVRFSSITDIKQTDINTDKVSPVGGHVPKSIEPKAIELANLMYELHKQVDPKLKSPNIEKWAADIEKINRLDGRSYEDIEKVIRWAKTPGNFWFANIMSGKKLRMQFSRLYIEANKKAGVGRKIVIQNDVYTGDGNDW